MRLFPRKDSPDTDRASGEAPAGAGSGSPPPSAPGSARDHLEELLGRIGALEGHVAALEVKLQELGEDTEERIRRLTAAIAEGIEHVDRSERRVRAVVQRAQQRVRDAGYEDAGLEAEAAELRRIDAEQSDGEGMQTVLEDLEHGDQVPFDFGGVPGEVTTQNLRELGLA